LTAKSLFKDVPGPSPAKSLAAAFGVEPDKAQAALDFMTQKLADRVERNTLSRGGLADVFDILARPAAGEALAQPSALTSADVAAKGNGILDVLLGSKHASRGVADKAARATGLDAETLKKMLPVVASMVVGALQAKAMPKIEKALAAAPLPLPGEAPARRPTAPLDLPRTSGPGKGGSPLPLPGDNIPGIEGPSRFPDLPDVIRRRGREIQIPAPGNGGGTAGGSLEEIIRQILANTLGFKNSGILAFILKVIFSRWFLGLISRILFRR
jgi:hypothetical protein